ncbi:hypothetical protein Ahy_A07g035865 [Arachis hypogaea]|uniref:Uncharacterized protein n=1 Tax=Arachis hypogaea TaxID=3818 RepID=A0A445CEU7_ARAHY|nr:hypothetical protein Ahy_A07g035865 [Arachis hypogaea]
MVFLPLQGWSERSFENSREGHGETSRFSLTIGVKWKCSDVRYSGVLGVEEPHQSIPNLVVKLYCGDDTVGEPLGRIDECIKDALAIANTSTSENSELVSLNSPGLWNKGVSRTYTEIYDDSINIFWGEREDTSIGGENWEIPYNPYISDKSHYMSTQDASSSPGLRKGTFGTPIGIKWKTKMK